MTHDFSSLPVSQDPEKPEAIADTKFAAFDRWMDIELAKLVERWIHAAAPNASRPQRENRRSR
jgi:hypothetical protein